MCPGQLPAEGRDVDLTTARAHRGLFPRTLSRDCRLIIKRMRKNKKIYPQKNKDGTSVCNGLFTVPSLHLYLYHCPLFSRTFLVH